LSAVALTAAEETLLRPWFGELTEDELASRLRALALYLETLRRWNEVCGLVGPRESERLVPRHVLPSLALAGRLPPEASLLDVGSGAGFPGLVIALRRPQRRVVLVERNGKKARFLEHVARKLELGGLTVAHDDVRHLREAPFDAITARAWGPAPELVAASRHLAHETTVWYLLKGRTGKAETAGLPAGWRAEFGPLFPAGSGSEGDFLLTVVRSEPPLPDGCPV
jgi:16S rRNA (guanine527-N7)-methyltransferase